MSFNGEFDEYFRDIDAFGRRLMKAFQSELDEILEGINSGEIKGTLKTRQIREPGVSGYVIQGRFGSDRALEPLEPLKPPKRRPMPEGPIAAPKDALEETREPLTDIFEEEKAIRIYVELPGEEKDDIHLNVKENSVEIKARNFHKTIELPKRDIDTEAVSSDYRNGVLKIEIPKKEEPFGKNVGQKKMV